MMWGLVSGCLRKYARQPFVFYSFNMSCDENLAQGLNNLVNGFSNSVIKAGFR
jgi:hypothetical protein